MVTNGVESLRAEELAVTGTRTEESPTRYDVRSAVSQLQGETMVLVLPALCLAGFALAVSEEAFPNHLDVALPGLALFVLPGLVLVFSRFNHLAGAWVLVLGCAAVDLLVAGYGGIHAAVYLLSVPVGLGAVFISVPASALVALVCSLLVAWAPSSLLPPDGILRAVTMAGMWAAIGLVWLTTHPLLTSMQWAWSSYEQSRRTLERARDYQVQLKQAMADLADANLQLTRLNRVATGLRETAEEARRAKEQFVANVSHELRTPLNMIIGFSEMMLQAPEAYGGNLPSALLADLTVIHRNSQHLASLIDDVLDISQIEAGRVALTKERVGLLEIIEAATVAVRPLMESKGLYLDVEVAKDLPPIACDRTRVRQVVLNLLSNAGRFTEKGGVRLRAWREGDDVAVSIADTGPGMGRQDLERIFQPFQQLDGSTRRRHGGSGLGLSISKHFVELHGGRMWVESEKGRGATFYFRLPIEPPTPMTGGVSQWFSPYWHYEERTHRSLAPRAQVCPRVVLLETGTALQRLLKRYLDGVELVAVATLKEAVAELSRTPASALLVNEFGVGETLRKVEDVDLPNGTPVIICSVPGAPEAADQLGVAGYLVKPLTRDALLATLDHLQLAGKTVLIVDDEPQALRLYRRMLAASGRGYRILIAGDGVQALNTLREERPDVVLLDLVMPQMDGFQFLEAKRQDPIVREIPVVVLSARDPAGQPVVTGSLAVTRRGGLTVHELLVSIEGLMRTLATAGQAGDPARQAGSPG